MVHESVIPKIESKYMMLTKSERVVADYFINNYVNGDSLIANELAKKLYVSEATLTRFAKKVGFTGYREFIFSFNNTLEASREYFQLKQRIIDDYQELLAKTYNLLKMDQLEKIAGFIHSHKRMYLYGKGSSGIAASEMKMRFMRLGVICDVVTDDHLLNINHVILDESCLVIGLSLSGKTKVVNQALVDAQRRGAKTVMITQSENIDFNECDEVVNVASLLNLNYGNRISPQIPLLLVTDIIYDFYMKLAENQTQKTFENTIQALTRRDKN